MGTVFNFSVHNLERSDPCIKDECGGYRVPPWNWDLAAEKAEHYPR